MSLVEDVASFLSAHSQGTNLYLGRLPDSPDDVAAVYQYAGRSPLFVHDKAGIDIERPALQVLVRSRVYATAQTRAYAIYTLLAAVVNATLGSTLYQRIEPLASPFLLDRDQNDRTVFAANFHAWKAP